MSYIEKEKLIKADIDSIENRVRHAFNQGYDLGYKEGKANCSKNSTCSTTKNNFGVDADKLISDCEKMSFDIDFFNKSLKVVALDAVKIIVNELPSVTPQEQEVIDKIRAEILRISSYGGYELGGYKDGYLNAMANVLSIIDKHTIGLEKE